MSSRDSKPEGDASNLSGDEEGFQVLGVARSNTAPLLELQECVFDKMALTIQMPVKGSRCLAVLARRNLSLHSLAIGLVDDGVTVVALVGNQMIGSEPFNQTTSL